MALGKLIATDFLLIYLTKHLFSDAFAGGFCAGIVEGKSLEECVKMGQWLAKSSLQELGPSYVEKFLVSPSSSFRYMMHAKRILMRLREQRYQTLAPGSLPVTTTIVYFLPSNFHHERHALNANTAHPGIPSRSRSTSLNRKPSMWKPALNSLHWSTLAYSTTMAMIPRHVKRFVLDRPGNRPQKFCSVARLVASQGLETPGLLEGDS